MGISVGKLVGASLSTAFLASCGGSNLFSSSAPPVAPLMGAHGAALQTISRRTAVPSSDRNGRSVTQASSRTDLLYVGSITTLFVFSYPKIKFLEEITLPEGGGGQVCSASNGDIFAPVSGPKPEILEYAHGGTQPIATLKSPAGTSPYACSVDPKTGNLAVTNFASSQASVEIYEGAKGRPKIYTDRAIFSFQYCSYDNMGNLFVTGSGRYWLAELSSGSTKFTNITVNSKAGGPAIQWDGKYITLGKAYTNKIYRMKIEGTDGKVAGITHLHNAIERGLTNQYWIQDGVIIRPTGKSSKNLGLWDYPAGKPRLKFINRHFGSAGIFSATVSGNSP